MVGLIFEVNLSTWSYTRHMDQILERDLCFGLVEVSLDFDPWMKGKIVAKYCERIRRIEQREISACV